MKARKLGRRLAAREEEASAIMPRFLGLVASATLPRFLGSAREEEAASAILPRFLVLASSEREEEVASRFLASTFLASAFLASAVGEEAAPVKFL